MWLGDIAKLPETQQYYLRSENVAMVLDEPAIPNSDLTQVESKEVRMNRTEKAAAAPSSNGFPPAEGGGDGFGSCSVGFESQYCSAQINMPANERPQTPNRPKKFYA